MNCAKCHDLLVEHALGTLAQADAQLVERHLAHGCELCERELAEIHETLGLIGVSLDEVRPSPEIKQRLLARVAADRKSEKSASSTTPAAIPLVAARSRRGWPRVFAYAATLLCGFFVGALATRYYVGDGVIAADRDAQLAEILESAQRDFGTPRVRFAALHSTENADSIVGHTMWDAAGRNLHFFAFDVAPPAENRELAVWFIAAADSPRYAGELAVSPSGSCSAVFEAPKEAGPVTQVVVTEEPAGNVTSPSGPQRIISRFE